VEVGLGGTSDGAVGRVAVKASLMLPLLVVLAGCKAAPQIAAVVTGGVAGAASGSPAVGFVVGVATDAGANYLFRYISRSRQGAEQDAIAQVAGALPLGTSASWKIEHTIPIGNEHGRLLVVRAIDTKLAACREIAFSVDDDGSQDQKTHGTWFTSDVCKQADTWKWASAEPAVERWGFLQ
jgi:hypothetical protein